MKNISASLNLPYRWNYKSQTMRCNGFSIGAPVYGSAGLIVDDDLVEREIKNEKIKAERAEKQKKIDEQKHRSVFHP